MKWLITGGCGFIGVNLVARLKRDGRHAVRVIDNLSVGKKEYLQNITPFVEVPCYMSPPDLVHDEPPQLLVGDVRDPKLALIAAEGVDVIVHLAANTGVIPSIEDPRLDYEVNVFGTFNYLEAARLLGVKRFIFASSSALMGEQEPPIHEEKVPHPISPYGASKLAGEGYCSAYHGAYGLKTVSLRFGNVYGPYSFHKNSVIAKFIKQALSGEPLVIYGDGNQSRDFIYVDDLIDAILAAAKLDIGGEIYQIATCRETTVNEITALIKTLIQELLGIEIKVVYVKRRPGEARRVFSDITKAKNRLNWTPRWELRAGLEKTIESFIIKR